MKRKSWIAPMKPKRGRGLRPTPGIEATENTDDARYERALRTHRAIKRARGQR